tara:strand:- start:210 stop:494 length:285 start_codon:yes stop_codon:yes gene_type:complete
LDNCSIYNLNIFVYIQIINEKNITNCFVIILFCSNLIADEKKYDHMTCSQIYVAVGYFLKEADKHWKKTKNEEKALEYSQAAANYSTVYQTFCK